VSEKFQIVIEVDPATMDVKVTQNIPNIITFLGMLDFARELQTRAHWKSQEKQAMIEVPKILPKIQG